jgi:hypothetical protein
MLTINKLTVMWGGQTTKQWLKITAISRRYEQASIATTI